MNAKTMEGLKLLIAGMTALLEDADTANAESNVKKTPVAPKTTTAPAKTAEAPAPAKAPAKTSKSSGIDKATLDAMTYNDLKKYAKEVGVPAVGNRDEITAKILNGGSAPAETTAPAKTAPAKTVGKKTAPAPEPEPEPEEEEEAEAEDDVRSQVEEAIADMSNEDLASILSDIGISPKGKREALVDKIVKAVEDGLLDFGDDEESEEGEEAPAEAESETESEEEEEDNVNDLENPDMTEERKEAIVAADADIRKQFKAKKIKRKDMVEFLQQFYDTEEDMKDMSDNDVLDTYIDACCRLIDDTGEAVEEGAYELNGQPACCGRLLAYDEEKNVYICEFCGTEYDAE
jgi:hypothetical protein